MKTYRKELWFETRNRREFQNITATIDECLHESGIQEGLLLCNAMHITSSVFINDDESGLHQDFETGLNVWHLRNHIRNTSITAMKVTAMHI